MRTGVRLGLDVGSVRVGVARSDPGGVLASPLEVIAHGRGDLDRLARLVASHDALEVIVGLPTTLAGREGPAAAGARQVASALAARIAPVPVRLFDERFTTTTAHAVLRQSGKNARARRPWSIRRRLPCSCRRRWMPSGARDAPLESSCPWRAVSRDD